MLKVGLRAQNKVRPSSQVQDFVQEATEGRTLFLRPEGFLNRALSLSYAQVQVALKVRLRVKFKLKVGLKAEFGLIGVPVQSSGWASKVRAKRG